MRSRFPLYSILPLLGTLCSGAVAGEVWTVSVTGAGADFSSIQAAIDVAADGDTVLVQPGTSYTGPLVIEDKALTVVVDDGEKASGMDGLTILNLPPNKSVLVSGIKSSLVVEDCAGEVLLQDCGGSVFGGTMFEARSSNRVSLVSCAFNGMSGPDDGDDGSDAIRITASQVSLYHVTARGGDGANGLCLGGPGDGGDGIVVTDQSFVRAVSSTFTGGAGGYSACEDGFWGWDVNVNFNSTYSTQAHQDLVLTGPSVVREGETIEWELNGVAGLEARSLTSTALRQRFLPESVGVLQVALPAVQESLGPIPANGVLQLSQTAPFLGAGDESRTRFVQFLVMDSGTRYLSNVVSLTVVDGGL